MSKISEKQQNKRTNILDAAYELFIKKSVNNTSIDDVVKSAGIAKGTFYLYFKDKHDLMNRIIIRKGALVLRYVLEELKVKKTQCDMTFTEQMLFITERIVDYLEKHKEIITLMGKNFSNCLSYFNSIEDDELKAMLNELVKENKESGDDGDIAMKKIYLIVTLVGSVCYDSLVFESPFKINEIKPMLMASVESILTEHPQPPVLHAADKTA